MGNSDPGTTYTYMYCVLWLCTYMYCQAALPT